MCNPSASNRWEARIRQSSEPQRATGLADTAVLKRSFLNMGEGKNQHPSCPQTLKACTPVFTDTRTHMHKHAMYTERERTRENQRDRGLLLGKDG